MKRYGIERCDTLLIVYKKIITDDTYATKYEWVTRLDILNKIAFNGLILSQEDTVCFNIIEEAKTKYNKYGNARQGWMKI